MSIIGRVIDMINTLVSISDNIFILNISGIRCMTVKGKILMLSRRHFKIYDSYNKEEKLNIYRIFKSLYVDCENMLKYSSSIKIKEGIVY